MLDGLEIHEYYRNTILKIHKKIDIDKLTSAKLIGLEMSLFIAQYKYIKTSDGIEFIFTG